MKKAIGSKYECPSCGNIIKLKQILMENSGKTKFSFDAPKSCGCGRKGGFKLLSFNELTGIIVSDEQLEKIEKIMEI